MPWLCSAGRCAPDQDDDRRRGNEVGAVVLTQAKDIQAHLVGELDGFE